MVARSAAQASNSFLSCRASTFPLDNSGISARGRAMNRLGILYADSSALSRSRKRRFVEIRPRTTTAATSSPRSAVGDAHNVSLGAGDLGDGLLDFGRGNIGARRLDHRAAPADEIHESVGVGAHQIACVEPAVGVEAVFAAALVVPLHQVRPPDAKFADSRGIRCRRSWSRTPAPACRTIRGGFGLVGFVTADQHDAAGFGHPEHVVPQFRVGRAGVGRHDRVQVAATHR